MNKKHTKMAKVGNQRKKRNENFIRILLLVVNLLNESKHVSLSVSNILESTPSMKLINTCNFMLVVPFVCYEICFYGFFMASIRMFVSSTWMHINQAEKQQQQQQKYFIPIKIRECIAALQQQKTASIFHTTGWQRQSVPAACLKPICKVQSIPNYTIFAYI